MTMKQKSDVFMSDVNLLRFNKLEEIVYKPMKKSTKQNLNGNVAETLKCNNILNRIWPPKEWEKDGKHYRQTISNQPAIKWEIKTLVDNFNKCLEQYKVREIGICPIRQEIYSQCFDETIRQETLNCLERGHLLIQIRDEIKTTVKAYRELNESVIANQIRRKLLQEQKYSDLEERMLQLKSVNELLKAKLAEINLKTEEVEREMAKAHDEEDKRQAKELNDMIEDNQLLKTQIWSIIKSTKRM